MLDLYQRRFAGETLGEKDFVICADEKTSIQARARKHPPPHRQVPDGPCVSNMSTNGVEH